MTNIGSLLSVTNTKRDNILIGNDILIDNMSKLYALELQVRIIASGGWECPSPLAKDLSPTKLSVKF
jgi:hypothetical protein